MPGIHFHFPTEEQFVRGFERIREEYEVSATFPHEVEEAAAAAADKALGEERRDMRDIPFVTVDPAGSRDLDQAFHAVRSGDGFRVRYAIADVAHFVAAGDPIDEAARARGVTFYAPDKKSPLHPDALSQGAASLLPDVDRPALVWTHDLDAYGSLVDTHIERAVVRSRAMLSYEDVDTDLRSGDPQEVHLLLREVGILRQKQEQTRGGISLRIPNQEIVQEDGTYKLSVPPHHARGELERPDVAAHRRRCCPDDDRLQGGPAAHSPQAAEEHTGLAPTLFACDGRPIPRLPRIRRLGAIARHVGSRPGGADDSGSPSVPWRGICRLRR